MITIIFRLTVSCLVAGLIMGTTFVFTNKAKKANEHAREEKVMYALLGYSGGKQIPESMGLHEIFRYVVTEGDTQSIGYLLPAGGHGGKRYLFICSPGSGWKVCRPDRGGTEPLKRYGRETSGTRL